MSTKKSQLLNYYQHIDRIKTIVVRCISETTCSMIYTVVPYRAFLDPITINIFFTQKRRVFKIIQLIKAPYPCPIYYLLHFKLNINKTNCVQLTYISPAPPKPAILPSGNDLRILKYRSLEARKRYKDMLTALSMFHKSGRCTFY
ncbi:hypothetical protein QTP88_026208 [Uroleucon formosanum]